MPDNPTTSSSLPKLRWYQFSLRTLLIFVTLVAVFFSWFGNRLRIAHEQRAAIAEIEGNNSVASHSFAVYEEHPKMPSWVEKLMGKDFCYNAIGIAMANPTEKQFKALDHIPNFQSLVIGDGKVTSEGFEHILRNKSLKRLVLMNSDFPFENLNQLESLEELSLDENSLKDEQLRYLDGLNNLQALNITSNSITDGGLASIKKLTGLKALVIASTSISDRGLKFIESAKNLESLTFYDVPVTDEMMEFLRDKKDLKNLRIERAGTITDKGMACLQDHVKLEVLRIDQPNSTITGKGFCYLENSISLEWLMLVGNVTIVDDDLKTLRNCKSLQILHLFNSKITGTGLKYLVDSKKLISLRLNGSDFNDEGIEFLNPLTASKITISGKYLTDAGIEKLKTKGIKSLVLEKTGITDKALQHLAQFTDLEDLYVGETAITFEGIKQFSPTKKLNLYIYDTPAAEYLKEHPEELSALQSLMPGVQIECTKP